MARGGVVACSREVPDFARWLRARLTAPSAQRSRDVAGPGTPRDGGFQE